jgi:hypothetical protein
MRCAFCGREGATDCGSLTFQCEGECDETTLCIDEKMIRCREQAYKEIIRSNPLVYNTLRAGGTDVDVIISLVKENEDYKNRLLKNYTENPCRTIIFKGDLNARAIDTIEGNNLGDNDKLQ